MAGEIEVQGSNFWYVVSMLRRPRDDLCADDCHSISGLVSSHNKAQTISFGEVFVPLRLLYFVAFLHCSRTKTLHLWPATNSMTSQGGKMLPISGLPQQAASHRTTLDQAIGPIFHSCLLCMKYGGPILWFGQELGGIPNEIDLISHGLLRFVSVHRKFICNGRVVWCCITIQGRNKPFTESNSMLFALSSLGLMNIEEDGSPHSSS